MAFFIILIKCIKKVQKNMFSMTKNKQSEPINDKLYHNILLLL